MRYMIVHALRDIVYLNATKDEVIKFKATKGNKWPEYTVWTISNNPDF